MHITGYLGTEDHSAVFRFIDAAARLEAFREIIPVRRQDGRIIAISFATIGRDEGHMSLIAERLSGILSRDVVIASAWAGPGDRRQCTWTVRGGRGAVLGEIIREPPALTA
jgi:hypothetical protein